MFRKRGLTQPACLPGPLRKSTYSCIEQNSFFTRHKTLYVGWRETVTNIELRAEFSVMTETARPNSVMTETARPNSVMTETVSV
jgi:hypothetical protein